MNCQTIFDTVAKHLRDQGERSVYRGGDTVNQAVMEWGDSAYYGQGLESGDDARCAIGCLIPKEIYSSDIEGERVSQLLKTTDDSYPGMLRVGEFLRELAPTDKERRLLDRLQWAHDEWADVDDLLHKIARDFGLEGVAK